jgi:hypothetical protein
MGGSVLPKALIGPYVTAPSDAAQAGGARFSLKNNILHELAKQTV